MNGSSTRKAKPCWAGAPSPPRAPTWARPPGLREPVVRQVFIGCNRDALVTSDDLAFERKLYVIRKRTENAPLPPPLPLPRGGRGGEGGPFYFPSFSSRTIVYKGMLLSEQVEELLPRPGRSPRGERNGPGALTLQHQHLPQLGARPSLPLHHPQRRDQYPARQHQLDARPPIGLRQPALWRRPEEDPAGDRRTAAATRPCSTTAWSSCT